jgi:hypothetical protein
MATYNTGVVDTITKDCQFCGRNEQHRILFEQVMYADPDTHGACVHCERKMSKEEKAELYRITPQSIYWYPETQHRHDHLQSFWQEEEKSTYVQPCLPDLVIFRIFLMITTVCHNNDDLISALMNFMKAMRNVIQPTSFLTHLKSNTSQHYKIWHDFLMYLRHSHFGWQIVPECLGHVCGIQAVHNPQLERIDIPDMGWHRAGNTSVGTCSCTCQTKWDIDSQGFSSLREDGCYSLGNIVEITTFNSRFRLQHNTVLCAKQFIRDLEENYREQFLTGLRLKLYLPTDEFEITTQIPEPDIPFFNQDGLKEDLYSRKRSNRYNRDSIWKEPTIHLTSDKKTKKKNKRIPRNQKKGNIGAFCADFVIN